jgi:hypothetical protein
MTVVAVGGATVAVAVVGPFVGVIVGVPAWFGVAVKSEMAAAVAVWRTSVGWSMGVTDGVGVRADWPFGPGPTVAAMTYMEVANRNITRAMMNAAAAVLLRLSYHPQPW